MLGAIVDYVVGLVFQILGIALSHPILASIALLGLFLYSTSGKYSRTLFNVLGAISNVVGAQDTIGDAALASR